MDAPRSEAQRSVLAARALRMFGYGLLSVALPVHLSEAGLSPPQIGLLFTVALAGGAAGGILVPALADSWGRRGTLVACAALMALCGAVLTLVPRFPVLLTVAALGLLSPSGQEVGPFQALEQAVLADTAGAATDVRPYARYDFVGFLAAAAGSLSVGGAAWALPVARAGTAPLLWGFVGVAVLLAAVYTRLPVRVPVPVRRGFRASLAPRSRRLMLPLTALFAVDALAGGLVIQSLVALWFHQKFGLGPEALGFLFFATNLLSALSFLLAPALARRLGLLGTMVGTHLPSNVLLAAVPLTPSWQLAAAVLLARHLLSQVDVPVRRAYTMALVAPEERAAAAGLTNAVRNVAAAVAPSFSGIALQTAASGLPFLVAGALKAAYDLALWFSFRHVSVRN